MLEKISKNIPLLGARLKEKQLKETRFQYLQQAIGNILVNIKKGGFVQEITEDGWHEKIYRVHLVDSQKRTHRCSFILELNDKKEIEKYFIHTEELDKNNSRQLSFRATRDDSSKPFFGPEWTGATMWTTEQVFPSLPRKRRKRLDVQNGIEFLIELSTATIDSVQTANDFNLNKSSESADWKVYWVDGDILLQ